LGKNCHYWLVLIFLKLLNAWHGQLFDDIDLQADGATYEEMWEKCTHRQKMRILGPNRQFRESMIPTQWAQYELPVVFLLEGCSEMSVERDATVSKCIYCSSEMLG
jgi:hypothetical protein